MEPKKNNVPEEESNISMLRKDLYARKEPEKLIRRSTDLFTPKQPVVRPESIVERQPDLIDVMKIRMARRKKILLWSAIILGGTLVFGSGIALTLWYRSTQQVNESHIGMEIASPARFTAGGVITYAITVTNKSRVAWSAVDMAFVPPSGFSYQSSTPNAEVSIKDMTVSLPQLPAGKSEKFEVVGRLIGEQDATALARAQVTISPANFPKEKITHSQTVTTVLSAIPLEISIEAAKNAAVGERISAIIHIRNLSSEPINGAVLQLDPAAGMQLATEDKGFSENFSVQDSFWKLPTIQPLEELIRYSVLYVQGSPADQRELGISISEQQKDQFIALRKISHVIAISASQLSVNQSFNGVSGGKLVVGAGKRVDGIVTYKNTGGTGLTDAIVKVRFEGSGLDAASIKLNSGAYDPNTNTLTWTAASLPALKNILPNTGGQIAYSFDILPYAQFPLQPNGKNQQLIATASVDSPNLPTPTGQARQVISDRFIMPVQTGLLLGVDTFYDDGRLGITSTGPIPPMVGQQTTYTLRVRLGSTLNDSENTRVTIVLPDGVTYTNQSYKTTGEIDFNSRTNTMIWTMPLLDGLTGRAVPPQELDMQIAITPGANKRGEEVLLAQSVNVVGKDSFTDNNISAALADLPTTRDASPQNGEVQ